MRREWLLSLLLVIAFLMAAIGMVASEDPVGQFSASVFGLVLGLAIGLFFRNRHRKKMKGV